MKWSSAACLVALVGSATAFTTVHHLPQSWSLGTAQSTRAVATPRFMASVEKEDHMDTHQEYYATWAPRAIPQQATSALVATALALYVAMSPIPVDAAGTATVAPVKAVTTVTTPAKAVVATKPAKEIPLEKKNLDAAKEAVVSTTKRLAELGKETKAAKSADAKAVSAVNAATADVERYQKSLERETNFLMNMSPKSTVAALQGQKGKIASIKTNLDEANKKLSVAKTERKATEAMAKKLSRDYDTTEKALEKAQKTSRKADATYKKYLERTAEDKKKAEKKAAEAKKKEEKQKAEQAKKAAEAKRKAEKKRVEQEKKAAEAKRKADEQARKKKAEDDRKAAQKAREDAAKAAKLKAEKIQKTQAKIESLELEKRNLVIKDAPLAKVQSVEAQIAESKAELSSLLKSKYPL